MNKAAVLIIPFLLAGLCAGAQATIAVTPPWHSAGNPLEDSLSVTVSDTLKLEFGDNDGFTLMETDRLPSGEGDMILYAREQGLDFVIFGRIDTVGGKIRLNLSMYDHKNRSVSVNRTVAVPKIKDIFQVTDRMFALLLADIDKRGSEDISAGSIDPALLFGGGRGTPADPFKISSVNHLINIDLYPEAAYTLTDDLNLTGISWVPVSGFNGTFLGNGHTISGLTISSALFESSGLFGVIGEKGSVTGLTLYGVSIKGKASSGALAGYNLGRITGCKALGDVDGTYYVGGIAGHNNGTISDCVFTGNITSRLTNTGGIAGENWEQGILSRCRFSGSIRNDGKIDRKEDYPDWVLAYPGNSMGGIAGSNFGTVTECSAEGDIFCIKDSTGGIIGYNRGVLSNSRFSGSIIQRGVLGGLIAGFNHTGSIRFCQGEGSLVCGEYGAGITGGNDAELSDCLVFRPVVSGKNAVPGLRPGFKGKAERYYIVTNPKVFTDATRREYADWDFETVWIMTEAGPRLRFEN
jgi:TolB-like protein